eukprot:scaffold6781_cov107-Isochrysis_galbana.AAC.8
MEEAEGTSRGRSTKLRVGRRRGGPWGGPGAPARRLALAATGLRPPKEHAAYVFFAGMMPSGAMACFVPKSSTPTKSLSPAMTRPRIDVATAPSACTNGGSAVEFTAGCIMRGRASMRNRMQSFS